MRHASLYAHETVGWEKNSIYETLANLRSKNILLMKPYVVYTNVLNSNVFEIPLSWLENSYNNNVTGLQE